MIGVNGPLLPLIALIWPLLLGFAAAMPPVRSRAIGLLPLAPLPALWLAVLLLAGEPWGPTLAPDLLLGVVLDAQRPAALLFGATALVWLAAAVHAVVYMAEKPRPAVFAGFWCLTLSGNLGVFLAADAVTFYVSFAAVSLAAYFLVVHEGTEKALHAGRVYAVLAIFGEVCLLLGMVIGASAAEGLEIAAIRAALPEAPLGGLAVALLVVGFGVKAGLMPLHVWLPLAHPAAPTPASAVLSGAIVKAGLIGLILFAPQGPTPGAALLALGFVTGFAGALLGLTQREPKAVLAYSTISQLGLMVALIGATLQVAGEMNAVAFYAAHHALAKGALFLAVGVAAAASGRWRWAVLIAAGVVALSVAGAPLTGGALAKAVAKDGLEGPAEAALTLSAATTTLVLVWFIVRLARGGGGKVGGGEVGGGAPPRAMLGPALLLGLGALAGPWLLWSGWTALPADYPLRAGALWSAFWPVAVGLAVAGVAASLRRQAPLLPQGDILSPLLRVGRVIFALWQGRRKPLARERRDARRRLGAFAAGMSDRVARAEAALLVWGVSGLAVLMLAVAIAVASASRVSGL